MSKFDVREDDPGFDDLRAYYDSRCLRYWHIGKKDRTFRISRIRRIQSEFKGEKEKKPQLYLETAKGKPVPLPLILNATNRDTIAKLYGTYDPKKLVGKLITLYVTTTDVAGTTRECIRVRPKKPRDDTAPKSEPPPMREPGDDTDEELDDAEPPPGALSTDGEAAE